jgi:hypothetical protein
MKKITTFLLLVTTLSVFAQVPPETRDFDPEVDGSGYGDISIPIGDHYSGTTNSLGAYREGTDKKWGIKNHSTNAILLPPEYDNINSTNGLYILRKGNKYGLASKEAVILLPVAYDSITLNTYLKGNSLQIKKNGKWGSIDFEAKPVLPIKFFDVWYSDAVNRLSIVKETKDGKPQAYFGDKKYKRELQRMYVFSTGVIGASTGKMGFIKGGKDVIPFEYDSVYTGSPYNVWPKKSKKNYTVYNTVPNNLIVLKNNKYGLIDVNGNVLYEPVYDKIEYDHMRKLYTITKDKKQGVYFEGSKVKTDIAYDDVYNDGAQFVTLKNNKKQGIIDYNGKWILQIEYEKATIMGYNDGFRIVKDGKAGWTDIKGNVIVQPIYDDIDDIGSHFKNVYIVTKDGKKGAIDKQNNVIVPVEFEYLFDRGKYIIAKTNDNKFGVYAADGTVVAKPKYDYILKSDTQGSPVLFTVLNGLMGIIGKDNNMLYDAQFTQIDYLYDQHLMVNPLNDGNAYRRVKDRNNKYGLFEEYTATMVVPVEYDGIYQKCEARRVTYFVAKKGKKFGIIDGKNNVVIPFEYDSINANMAQFEAVEARIVAVKNKKFGVINLKNQVIVPFEYKEVAKISYYNIFKARKKDTYVLLNDANKVLNAGPFDQIAQFEDDKALTFYKGQMRVVNKAGAFTSQAVTMQRHDGYATFDDLKFALVKAMDSKDNALLQEFAGKVAPSEHILYYVTQNMFNKKPLSSTDPDYIKQRYFKDLLEFKQSEWGGKYYKRESLTLVPDYTMYRQGYITVERSEDWAYGNGFMERLLRNAIKINGYWISTYFMTRQFE